MLSVKDLIAAPFDFRDQAAASSQGSLPRRASRERIVRLVALGSAPDI